MGLDVAYTKISGMSAPAGSLLAGNIAFPAGTNTLARNITEQDNWLARFRVHRDFYP